VSSFGQAIDSQMHYLDKHFLSIGLLGSCHELMDQIIILLHIQELTKNVLVDVPNSFKGKERTGQDESCKK
jgi:hypothetical protein